METNKIWSEYFIASLLALGVEKFCIAPGGQSTALVAAIDRLGILPTVHYDERGLAYYGLGWGKKTGFPAAVITTSGTAVANLMPAVMEAFYAREPLLLITADLCWEQTDSGYNQSCQQANIFSAYTKWSFDFPAPQKDFNQKALHSILKQAVSSTLGAPAGPVHLNLRFKAPLFSASNNLELIKVPKQKLEPTKLLPSEMVLAELRDCLSKSNAGIVVLGQMPSWINRKPILEFLKELRWPVLADILSGFRGEDGFCSHFPIYLSNAEFRENLKPDCILHLGGDIVLRPPAEPFVRGVHQYLNQTDCKRIVINENFSRQDPFTNVDLQVTASIDLICKSLGKIKQSSLYNKYLELENQASKAVVELEFGEVAALSQVLTQIDSALFVGNSLPLREVDYLLTSKIKDVVSAHGLKGIDGIIAMAAGFRDASGETLTLVLGDISFLYDLNSLSLLKDQKINLVVLNNDGGQIFSYVDCKNTKCFERNFLNPHGMSFKNIAQQFEIEYSYAQDLLSLNKALAMALESKQSVIIEVKSDGKHLHEQQISLFSNTIKRLKS